MDVSRPLIFIEPYSESLEKLKEATEEIAEDESFDIYEVEELSEVGQLLPTVGPALLISANPKKCAMILQSNRRVIAQNRSKVILLSQKRIPEKTLQKFMKIGLSECIVEPVVPKTLMYKVKLLIRSLPNLDKDTDEEVVIKALEAKAAEEADARRLERGVEEDGEEGEETEEDKEKGYREEALSDLYGKREKTENGETLSSYYKGSMKKRDGEEGYEEEEEEKSKYTEEIDSYYRGETEGVELDLEEGEKKKSEKESFEDDEKVDLKQLKDELTLDITPEEREEEEEQSTEKIDKYYRGETEGIELDLEEGDTKHKSAEVEEEEDDLILLESKGELELEEGKEAPEEEELLDLYDEEEEEKKDQDVELELIAPKKSPLTKDDDAYEEDEEKETDEDIELELLAEEQLEEEKQGEEEENAENLSGQGSVDRLDSKMSSSLDPSKMKQAEKDGMKLKQLQNGEEGLEELEDDFEEEPLIELTRPKKDKSTLQKPEEEEDEEEDDLELLQPESKENDDEEEDKKEVELELELTAPTPMKPKKEDDDEDSLEPLEKDIDLQLEPGQQSREMQKQQEKDFQRTKSLEDHQLQLEKDKNGKIKNHGVDHISTYYGLKKPLNERKSGGDWEKQKRGETLEGYKRDKKDAENILDFSNDKNRTAQEQGPDEEGNLQAADVLDYSKKAKDDGDKSLQYADSDLGEQVIDYKKIKEDFELMGDVIGPRKTKTISIVDNSQTSEEYDVTEKKAKTDEEEKQKTLIDISAPVLEGEEAPSEEEILEEEEEEPTKVYVPDSKGLEFAIEALDYYQNIKKKEEDIFHYIGNAIFKSQKGVTTFFQRNRQTGEIKEIFRGHREFGPHEEMSERIDAWEAIKQERLTTWTTMALPTWSDTTFQEEHIEFFYPLIVGNEKMGFAITTFEEGFKEENCKKVEIMLEVTRGLYLENFYQENRAEASYGDQTTDQEEESKKSKGFFKGLFKKKAG